EVSPRPRGYEWIYESGPGGRMVLVFLDRNGFERYELTPSSMSAFRAAASRIRRPRCRLTPTGGVTGAPRRRAGCNDAQEWGGPDRGRPTWQVQLRPGAVYVLTLPRHRHSLRRGGARPRAPRPGRNDDGGSARRPARRTAGGAGGDASGAVLACEPDPAGLSGEGARADAGDGAARRAGGGGVGRLGPCRAAARRAELAGQRGERAGLEPARPCPVGAGPLRRERRRARPLSRGRDCRRS